MSSKSALLPFTFLNLLNRALRNSSLSVMSLPCKRNGVPPGLRGIPVDLKCTLEEILISWSNESAWMRLVYMACLVLFTELRDVIMTGGAGGAGGAGGGDEFFLVI